MAATGRGAAAGLFLLGFGEFCLALRLVSCEDSGGGALPEGDLVSQGLSARERGGVRTWERLLCGRGLPRSRASGAWGSSGAECASGAVCIRAVRCSRRCNGRVVGISGSGSRASPGSRRGCSAMTACPGLGHCGSRGSWRASWRASGLWRAYRGRAKGYYEPRGQVGQPE